MNGALMGALMQTTMVAIQSKTFCASVQDTFCIQNMCDICTTTTYYELVCQPGPAEQPTVLSDSWAGSKLACPKQDCVTAVNY